MHPDTPRMDRRTSSSCENIPAGRRELLAHLTDVYRNRTVGRGISEATADARARHVRQFTDWVRSQSGVDPLAPPVRTLEQWINRARVHRPDGTTGPPAQDTRRQRRDSLIGFWDFLIEAGQATDNPAARTARISVDRSHPAGIDLNPADIAALVAAAEAEGPGAYAVVRAIADTGMRPVEARRALIRDYRPRANGGPHLRTVGRNRLVSLRPLPSTTTDAITKAMHWRRMRERRAPGHREPLFMVRASAYGPPVPLTRHRVNALFHRIAERAGLAHVGAVPSATDLRRSWIRHAACAGYLLPDIAAEIGHRDISTSLIYLARTVSRPPDPTCVAIQNTATTIAEGVQLYRAANGGEPVETIPAYAEAVRAATLGNAQINAYRAALAEADSAMEQLRAQTVDARARSAEMETVV